ncbi:MAG: MFS transporter [Microbacterium sp.]
MLLSASLGTFVVILLTSGLNIALPSIRAELGSGESAAAWILAGYTLAFAMFSISGGALSDRFGAQRTFAAGLIVFVAASLVAAVAPTTSIVIVGTFGQGVGAALVLPAALAIIDRVYRGDDNAHATAVGIWAGANALGAAVGPVLCGALVSVWSWRVLFVAVAVVAAVVVGIGVIVFPRLSGMNVRLDVPGQVLMVALLGTLTYVAHDAAHLGLWMIIAGVALVVALAVAFWWVERRVASPLLPMSQLRDVAFSGNAIVTILGTAAFFGTLYIVSIGLQEQNGYTPFMAGVALLPLALGNVVAALGAGWIVAKLGTRRTLLLASLVVILPMPALPLVFDNYVALATLLAIIGFGWGLHVPTTSTAGLARASQERAGLASGVTSGGRELGAALAAAVILPLGLATGTLWAAIAGAVSLVVAFVTVRGVDHKGATAAH